MIGERRHFTTPSGDRVSALVYDTKGDLPLYDVEIVNPSGEVIEYFELAGWYTLEATAIRRRWADA